MKESDNSDQNATKFSSLPAQMLVKIFGYLDTFQQIVRLKGVCTSWKEIIMEHSWPEPSHLRVNWYHPSFLPFLEWASIHSNLHELSLHSAAIPTDVIQTMPNMPIQDLSLAGHWKFQGSSLHMLSAHLRRLDLSGTNFLLCGPAPPGLHELTSLTELRLCHLAHQPYLRSCTTFTMAGSGLQVLLHFNAGLKVLYLDDNPTAVKDDQVAELLGAPCTECLHTLSLARCSHVTAVGEVCMMLTQLKHLNVERTSITDSDVEMVVDSCPDLEYLNIGGCMQIRGSFLASTSAPNCLDTGSVRTLLMPDLPRIAKEDVASLLKRWVDGLLAASRSSCTPPAVPLSLELSCCGLVDDDVLSCLLPLGNRDSSRCVKAPESSSCWGYSKNGTVEQMVLGPHLHSLLLSGCCHISAGMLAKLAANGVYNNLQVLDLSHFNDLRKEPKSVDLSILIPLAAQGFKMCCCADAPLRAGHCEIKSCPGSQQRFAAVPDKANQHTSAGVSPTRRMHAPADISHPRQQSASLSISHAASQRPPAAVFQAASQHVHSLTSNNKQNKGNRLHAGVCVSSSEQQDIDSLLCNKSNKHYSIAGPSERKHVDTGISNSRSCNLQTGLGCKDEHGSVAVEPSNHKHVHFGMGTSIRSSVCTDLGCKDEHSSEVARQQHQEQQQGCPSASSSISMEKQTLSGRCDAEGRDDESGLNVRTCDAEGRDDESGLNVRTCGASCIKALVEAANPFYACVAVHLSRLKVLNLDSCWLDDTSACLLARCCTQLETLHVVGCKALGNEGLAALTSAGKKLRHLYVGGASYSWKENQALKNLQSLHTLQIIRRTMLQDRQLVEVLNQASQLRTLALAVCSSLTDAGLASVPDTVEELKLTACDGIQGTTIPRLRRLRHLKLSTCPGITRQALHAIAVNCTRLAYLQLPAHLSADDLPYQAPGGHLSSIMVVGDGQKSR